MFRSSKHERELLMDLFQKKVDLLRRGTQCENHGGLPISKDRARQVGSGNRIVGLKKMCQSPFKNPL